MPIPLYRYHVAGLASGVGYHCGQCQGDEIELFVSDMVLTPNPTMAKYEAITKALTHPSFAAYSVKRLNWAEPPTITQLINPDAQTDLTNAHFVWQVTRHREIGNEYTLVAPMPPPVIPALDDLLNISRITADFLDNLAQMNTRAAPNYAQDLRAAIEAVEAYKKEEHNG